MPTLWLPPKVWFHGSQSTITGGSSCMKASTCAVICWLAQIMRWVLITPLGCPVEPEVNRILATVSGVVRTCAASTAAVGAVASSSANSGRARRHVVARHDLDVARHGGGDGARELPPVRREHQAGRQQRDDVLELGEIARDQRVGRRDRRIRHPDMLRRERRAAGDRGRCPRG
jgi:hypothetical protein